MALIDHTIVKTLLGITGTAEDDKLVLMCSSADAAIKRYCNRDLESTTYPGAAVNGRGDSGLYSGNGSRYLLLRQYPVTAVTSVYQDASGRWDQNPDGSFQTATLLTVGTDYALPKDGYQGAAACVHRGVIERVNTVWPAGYWYRRGVLNLDEQTQQGNVKVAYTAGYVTVPDDLVQAAALLVAYWRRIQKKGGNIQSESLGAYSYSLAQVRGGLPDEVRMLLAKYRNVTI